MTFSGRVTHCQSRDGISSEDGITLFTLLKILAQVYEIRNDDFE